MIGTTPELSLAPKAEKTPGRRSMWLESHLIQILVKPFILSINITYDSQLSTTGAETDPPPCI